MSLSQQPPHRAAYSVEEVAVIANVGRDAVYDAIRNKRLVARKWGRRTVITPAALQTFLDGLPELDLGA